MHEISIALRLVELAESAARAAQADRVFALRIRVGALSGVAPSALAAAFPVAAEDSLCAGAALEIDAIGATVYCAACAELRESSAAAPLECPACGALAELRGPAADLELVSIEVQQP